MTTTTVQRPPRNGVDVPTLFATLDAVKGAPQIAQFQFRATNEWVSGTHNRSTIQGFYGAGQEDTSRAVPFTYDADHPAVLVGSNQGPRRWSSCCMPSPPASRQAWRTSPPPEASPCGGSPRPSRVTSTCSASSASPTSFATATGRSGCTSTSRATRRRNSWARSSSSPAGVPLSTTCSSTAPMSRSMSAPLA